MDSPESISNSWKDLFVAGLGGGAIHAVTDMVLSQVLAGFGQSIGGTGLTLKDIALILIGKYGADRTSGMFSTALTGMAVIGIYKVVYPMLIQPIVGGLGGLGGTTVQSSAPVTESVNQAALAYAGT